jgi:nucleoside-diphosphate-sugar epimerase
MTNPLAADLDHVIGHSRDLWEELRDARLFVTGGTGFFGTWLLETFAWANDRLNLGASAVVLTRDSRAFADKAPHLASHPAIAWLDGDVRTFPFPDGAFSHVVHAATASSAPVPANEMFDTITRGTRRALELAGRSGASRFLLTSSGAVYGRQPAEVTHVPEEYVGTLDPAHPAHAYADGKRAAERLCGTYADSTLHPTIARGFAFVGPYLPLDVHFAAGNFIRDALQGGPIRVGGDGTPFRSYLYAADLAIWLWTILLRGQPARPYNVGSERAVSIGELARLVAAAAGGGIDVRIAKTPSPGAAAERYVPSTARARDELGLAVTVELEEGLSRTVEWHRRRPASTYVGH